jgi:hypothetical protein
MAAALPHVDEFIEGHSVASLEHLAAVVSRDDAPVRKATGEGSPRRYRTVAPRSPCRDRASSRSKVRRRAIQRHHGRERHREVAGSVSGGCVEGAVVAASLEVLEGTRERA